MSVSGSNASSCFIPDSLHAARCHCCRQRLHEKRVGNLVADSKNRANSSTSTQRCRHPPALASLAMQRAQAVDALACGCWGFIAPLSQMFDFDVLEPLRVESLDSPVAVRRPSEIETRGSGFRSGRQPFLAEMLDGFSSSSSPPFLPQSIRC
jgi:hypothetical protein